MGFEFTVENQKMAQEILNKYPESRRFSASMPLLTLAQKQNNGNLNSAIIDYLAVFLNVSPMDLYEVANFYSMYRFQSVGKYHLQFCASVVCLITDYAELYNFCKTILKVEEGQVSKDGLFSLEKVECLGACANAPAFKINDIFVEGMTKEELQKLLGDLRNGKEFNVLSIVKKPILMEANENQ